MTASPAPLVLLLDAVHEALPKGLAAMGFALREAYDGGVDDIPEWEKAEGLVIRSRFPLDAAALEKAPHLRWIARVGAGLENIDQATAEKRGITVFHAPEGNRDAVGEHALGMLLSLLHHLPRADREVRQGRWRRAENRGTELRHQTVGIIGYGHMGSALAEKLQGLGCRLLLYDKYKSHYAPPYAEEVRLARLQAEADIISLHTPQTPETEGLIDAAFWRALRKPVIFINTARGRSVVTEDLVEALQTGQVKGACLDVHAYEKSSFEGLASGEVPPALRYLWESEQVMLSPHIAGWTHQSHRRMAEVLLFKIKQHYRL
jgi:D-3-phosphoglycerate dehydrogenase